MMEGIKRSAHESGKFRSRWKMIEIQIIIIHLIRKLYQTCISKSHPFLAQFKQFPFKLPHTCQPRCLFFKYLNHHYISQFPSSPLAHRHDQLISSLSSFIMAFVSHTPLHHFKSQTHSLTHQFTCTASPTSQSSTSPSPVQPQQSPLLVRTALGQPTDRPPVWLMRQAGRYMSVFREYSDILPFRERSETVSIATELSLQPFRAFPLDAVILFSDILTPLPSLGRSFSMKPGVGPIFSSPLSTNHDIDHFIQQPFDPQTNLSFVQQILVNLRDQLSSKPDVALVGFAGAPFTLAAYLIEGRGVKSLAQVKRLMYGNKQDEQMLRKVLEKLADVVATYLIFQIDSGAQIVQLFESWAHHLSPDQFTKYALPFTKEVIKRIKEARPETPVAYFVNGSAGKLDDVHSQLKDVLDVIAVDWGVKLAEVRRIMNDDLIIQGNVDPGILAYGCEEEIRKSVRDTVNSVGKDQLILNLGHGVIKETPEWAVKVFCEEVRSLAS